MKVECAHLSDHSETNWHHAEVIVYHIEVGNSYKSFLGI